MRPQYLEIDAFGPFHGHVELDFCQLESHSLFLIHGDTGSGKSSILDAICFALYGVSAGGERAKAELRSDQADPGRETRVRFDFSLGSERYRVERWPTQQRPKKRGEGTTERKADARLYALDAQGSTQHIRQGERPVSQELVERLGFSAEQFRQVVVLPQGQFRKLLTDHSSEREKILRRLFGTRPYERVEARLKERAKALKTELSQTEAHLKGLLSGVLMDLSPEEQTLAAAEHRGRELEAGLKVLQAETVALEPGVELARKAHESAKTLKKSFESLGESRLEWQRHEAKGKEQAARIEEFEAAERAAGLDDLYRQWQQGSQELKASQKSLVDREMDLKSSQEERVKAEAALSAAKTEAACLPELGPRLTGLELLLPKLAELQAYARDEHAAAKVLVEAENRKLALEDQLRTLEGELESLGRRRQDGELAAAALSSVQAELEQARKRESQLMKLKGFGERLGTESAALQRALEVLTREQKEQADARAALERAQRQQLEQRAGLLSATLVDHQPCPVCGSTEHPDPAPPVEATMDAQTLEEEVSRLAGVDRSLQSRDRELNGQASSLRELKIQEADLRLDLDLGDGDVVAAHESAARDVVDRTQRVKSSEKRVAQIDELKSQETAARAGREKLAEELVEALKALRDADRVRERTRTQVQEARALVPEELREPGAIESRIQTLRSRIQTLEKALEDGRTQQQEGERRQAAAQSARDLQAEAVSRQQEEQARLDPLWYERLKAAGFADEGARQAAQRTERDHLELQIQRHEKAGDRITQTLEELSALVEGKELPELEALATVLSERVEAHRAKVEETAASSQSLTGLRTTLEQYSQERAALGGRDARYRLIAGLAEVADGKGSNQLKLSFERWVLGEMLDEVLVAASHRLLRMSRGRFALSRRDVGTRSHGLDIDVYDSYSDQCRPAHTLSGGEGFMAALSLALGLADVVQSEKGGVHIEAVFVDEGFGSLDPDSLERALSTLIEIQADGRMVGLISHVPELQERLDVQLRVETAEQGSVLTWVLP